MTALASHNYTPDPDAMTDRERRIVEAWNAAYPADAVEVTVWGHGKIAAKAFFETEYKRRWMEIVKGLDEGVQE